MLDKIDSIYALSASSSNVSIHNDTVVWKIEKLLPGKSLTTTFEVRGLFNTIGLRSLSRAIATAININTGHCVISNISSGSPIRVLDYINDLKKTCIIVDKTFSRYKHKICFENISINIDNKNYKNIIFEPGFILENTLIVTDIKRNRILKGSDLL